MNQDELYLTIERYLAIRSALQATNDGLTVREIARIARASLAEARRYLDFFERKDARLVVFGDESGRERYRILKDDEARR